MRTSRRLTLLMATIASATIGVSTLPAMAATPSPEVISGTLYAPGGDTVVAGGQVRLTAWPEAALLDDVDAGELVPTRTVATTTTDQEGHFSFSSGSISLPPDVVEPDGSVNLTVESDDGSTGYYYSLSMKATKTKTTATRSTSARSATTSSDMTIAQPNAQSSDVALTSAEDGSEAEETPGDASNETVTEEVAPKSTEPEEAPDAASKCGGWAKSADLGQQWVTVGTIYSKSGVDAKLTYTSGGSNTVGVGVSSTNKAGSYKASGTSTVSTSNTLGFPTRNGTYNHNERTKFKFARYINRTCKDSVVLGYQVKAYALAGGMGRQNRTRPTANHCTRYSTGGTFTKNSTAASTFTAGADTAGWIGISLSSQSGYNRNTSLSYTFKTPGQLCGTLDDVGDSPGQIVVK